MRASSLARGGQGGRGNARFATPVRQTPRFAEVGEPPEEAEVELRLKLLADAAMAGLPNAGKSSLLRRLSNAKPKVADYPFTTLAPVLGTVESPDGAQLTVADVPGLIEGASEGIGLGHEFLAHLERARLLLHVIDASEEDVEERFRTIDTELALYGAGLDERPQAIVLNKIDLLPEPPVFPVEDERIVGVFPVSCATGAGIRELELALFRLCPAAPEPVFEEAPELPEFLEYRPQPPARRTYRIYRTDRGFRIIGEAPQGEGARGGAQRRRGARKGKEVEIGEETSGVAVTLAGSSAATVRPAARRPRRARADGRRALRHRRPARQRHRRRGAQGFGGVLRGPPRDGGARVRRARRDGRAGGAPHHGRGARGGRLRRPDLPDRRRRAGRVPDLEEPERVLELARLGVATRPGYAPTTTSPRIQIFELEPHPVSSSEIRERVRSGEPLDGLVAPDGRRSTSPSTASTAAVDVRVSRLH